MTTTFSDSEIATLASEFELKVSNHDLKEALTEAESAYSSAVGSALTRRHELMAFRDHCVRLDEQIRTVTDIWQAMGKVAKEDLAWSAVAYGGTRFTQDVDVTGTGADYDQIIERFAATLLDLQQIGQIAATSACSFEFRGPPKESRDSDGSGTPLDGLRAVAGVLRPFWLRATGRRFVKADRDNPNERKHNRAEDFLLAVAIRLDSHYTLSNCKSVLKKPGL